MCNKRKLFFAQLADFVKVIYSNYKTVDNDNIDIYIAVTVGDKI